MIFLFDCFKLHQANVLLMEFVYLKIYNILNHSLLKYTLESDLGKIQFQTDTNNDTSMYEEVL